MPDTAPADGIYDIDVTTIDGRRTSMREFRGRTLLIVNVASRCGFTPQYEGLERLHQQFRDAGLVVMGFPCDQFGHQEPGTEQEIQEFCRSAYGVTFPMFAKVDVNGPGAHPLFAWLKARKKGLLGTEGIKWNFTKFLVSPEGEVLRRYAPSDTPEAIASDLSRTGLRIT
jgi:glutathione peroxidase